MTIFWLFIFLGIGWFIYNSLRNKRKRILTVKEVEQDYLKGKELILLSLREHLTNELKNKTKGGVSPVEKTAVDMEISMIGKTMDEIAEKVFKWNQGEVEADIAIKKYRLIKKFYKNIAEFIFDSFRGITGPEEVQNEEWYKIWDATDRAQTKIEVEEVIGQMARESDIREEMNKK